MLTLTVDASDLQKRLEAMTERLKKLGTVDIGDELYNWQAEDMHRRQPRTRVSVRGKRASTIIRPHSRAEMRRSHRIMMRARRRKGGGGWRHWSTRPILRAELYDKLVTRMNALLETVKW